MNRLVIASKNVGKIKEIKGILEEFPLEIISMREAGFDNEIEENGTSFQENALLKAQYLYQHVGGMVLSDDSGLEIDFLNGAPGIYTARFAGDYSSQKEKNAKIIHLLKGVEQPYRKARFVCSIAFVSRIRSFIVTGSVEGIIGEKPEGDTGFGYDPIFYFPELKKTFAQLPDQIKNKISHRAKALEKLRDEFRKFQISVEPC